MKKPLFEGGPFLRVTFSEIPYHENNYLLSPSHADKKIVVNIYIYI